MESEGILYFARREEWRAWLSEHFDRSDGIWFVFPKKGSGLEGISYNDAVEEALCFGWIDSKIKAYDEKRTSRPGSITSSFQRATKESV